MKKFFNLSAALFLILTSCTNDVVTFKIYNKSDYLIDTLTLSLSEENIELVKDIKMGDTKNISMKFDESVTGDGSYFMEVYQSKKSLKTKTFGYYTNGKPLNTNIKIEVQNDTILVYY